MSDGELPGSAHQQSAYSVPEKHIRITFVPIDVQEPYRTFVVETFTELVIVMQHEWHHDDSLFEVKWEDKTTLATTYDAPLPGMGDADSLTSERSADVVPDYPTPGF